jgi:ribosome-associated heat shock protein Hsp15
VTTSDDAIDPPGTVRLDKWLWAARFFKTRALAAESIDGGKISVNDERPKRSKLVRAGDTVAIRIGPYQHTVLVRDVSARRGSATIAHTLYDETAASATARAALSEQYKSASMVFAHHEGKPSKQERRAMQRVRGRS